MSNVETSLQFRFLQIETHPLFKPYRQKLGASLVRVASERARLLDCEERLDFRHASATKIPFSPKTFDMVLALECAFHFNTRHAFLQEAARILKCGGRIAIADMFCAGPSNVSPLRMLMQNLFRRLFHIPDVNLWTEEEYKVTLRGLGFQDISIVSIAEHVFRPFSRQWVQFDKRSERRQDP